MNNYVPVALYEILTDQETIVTEDRQEMLRKINWLDGKRQHFTLVVRGGSDGA